MTQKMATSDGRNDNVQFTECVNDDASEVAEILINVLRKIDTEYDALVKEAEENLEPNTSCYEIGNYSKDGQQYFVHGLVEQKISIIDETKRRFEEKELDNNFEKIHKMLKTCQREKEIFIEKGTIMKRKLNMERKQVDSLNQLIKDTLIVKEREQITHDQLKILSDELDKMVITNAIYPDSILQLHTACNELQLNISKMEEELLKYPDLPPDYERAREKLAEVMLLDQELERQIRSIISRT